MEYNDSSNPLDDAEAIDFLKNLVLSNFILMIQRRDKSSIYDLLNDNKKIELLLCSLGNVDGLVNNPAHMGQLITCMKDMLSDLLDAMRDDSSGYEVKLEEDGLRVNVEDFIKEQKYKLTLNSTSYEFELTSNIGEVKRRIKGDNNIIATYSKYSHPYEDKDVLSQKTLDEYGFVIEETTEEVSKKRSKRSSIKRVRLEIISDSNQTSFWNGKPFELNKKSASSAEFSNNMCLTIIRYPETREYYESIIGKKLVDQIMKIYEQRQKS